MRHLFATLLLINACSSALAADAKLAHLGPLAGKVDPVLIPALDALHNGTATASTVSRGLVSVMPRAQSAGDSGKLVLNLDVPAVSDTILKQIEATGAQVLHSSARWNSVSVSASIDAIDALTRLPGIRTIQVALKPFRYQQGIANNQADGSMKADQARTATGLSGAGQKIGVLSDTFNRTNAVSTGTTTGTEPNAFVTVTTPQLSGDLPASIQVVDGGPDDGSGTDEGEAMMELIHDIAPNAALVFASGDHTQTIYADNLLKLRQAGCTITCDDISFPDEPMFQDGPVSQAITANYAAGIPHFSSAGNDFDNGVFTTYVPVTGSGSVDTGLYPPNGIDFHDWGIGGATPAYLPLDIRGGRTLTMVLQWNQPFQSYNLGAGSSVDLDLYVYDAPGGNIIAKSIKPQFSNGIPGGDPLEIVNVDNPGGSTLRVYLAVNHAAGSRANTIFRLVSAGDNTLTTFAAIPTGGTGPTIYGHTACAEALSIAAIFYADIDSGGGYNLDPLHVNVEGYTSKGGIGAAGVPFYFDTTGAALPGGIQRRDKPDVSAPDGGNTSVFGNDINIVINGVTYDPDKLPNFFGTSAAAPNAAAVAALLMERASLSTPAQIKNALQSTAIDIVADKPLSVVGPDDRSGAGLINALAAVNAVPGITQQPIDAVIDPNQNALFTITAAGSATLHYQWQKDGVDIPNENAPTLSLLQQPISADSTAYACVVSNAFGAAISNSAKLFVNHSPSITSGPTADPFAVKVGVSVQFAVVAQALNGQPLTITWDFGDGTNTTGDTVTHAYAAVGAYTVTMTATDSTMASTTRTLLEIVYLDANSDGQPDLNSAVDNAFYPDALKRLNNLTSQTYVVKKLAIGLNFKYPGKDTVLFTGSLPLPPLFTPLNQSVVTVIGGIGRSFMLNIKGKALALPDASFTLKFQANKPAAQTGTYTFKIAKGTLQSFVAAAGLTNKIAKNEHHTIRATIYFNGILYDQMQSQSYTSRIDVSGKTK